MDTNSDRSTEDSNTIKLIQDLQNKINAYCDAYCSVLPKTYYDRGKTLANGMIYNSSANHALTEDLKNYVIEVQQKIKGYPFDKFEVPTDYCKIGEMPNTDNRSAEHAMLDLFKTWTTGPIENKKPKNPDDMKDATVLSLLASNIIGSFLHSTQHPDRLTMSTEYAMDFLYQLNDQLYLTLFAYFITNNTMLESVFKDRFHEIIDKRNANLHTPMDTRNALNELQLDLAERYPNFDFGDKTAKEVVDVLKGKTHTEPVAEAEDLESLSNVIHDMFTDGPYYMDAKLLRNLWGFESLFDNDVDDDELVLSNHAQNIYEIGQQFGRKKKKYLIELIKQQSILAHALSLEGIDADTEDCFYLQCFLVPDTIKSNRPIKRYIKLIKQSIKCIVADNPDLF